MKKYITTETQDKVANDREPHSDFYLLVLTNTSKFIFGETLSDIEFGT